jgi:hypothetical protein
MKKYIIYNYVGNGFWGGVSRGFEEGFVYNDKVEIFESKIDAENEINNNIISNYQGVFEVIEVFRNI